MDRSNPGAVSRVSSLYCENLKKQSIDSLVEKLSNFLENDDANLVELTLLLKSLCLEEIERSKIGDAIEKDAREMNSKLAVIFIEHMNVKSYETKLFKWSSDLGLKMFLLRQNPPKKRFAENIYIILFQTYHGCSEFVTRLRTRNVDRNAKGVQCKERKWKLLLEIASDEVLSFANKMQDSKSIEYSQKKDLKSLIHGELKPDEPREIAILEKITKAILS